MNKNNFDRKLNDMLNSEEIKLPDELSAENIEKLLNEKGGIVNPKRPVSHISKKFVKILASAAAFVVLLAGVIGVADVSMQQINRNKKDEILNTPVEDKVSDSDYSQIETLVLNYYKDIFSRKYENYESFADKLVGAVDDMAVLENGVAMEDAEGIMDMPAGSTSGTSSSTNGTHSSTNVQVSGIDEADIIKNDGRYIYYLTNNVVIVTDCADGKNMDVVAKIELADVSGVYVSDMYLYNDKLVVICNKETTVANESQEKTSEICDCLTYALYCDTVVTVYDMADKSAPRAVYTQTIDGNYVTSRFMNGKLITVSEYSIPYNYVRTDDFDEACEAVKGMSVPCYNVNDGEIIKVPADRINCFNEKSPTQYTVTAVTDIDNPDSQPKVNAYLGGGYEVYCTYDEMFIAAGEYSYWTQNGEVNVTDALGQKFDSITHIYKLDITDDGVVYNKDVKVGGRCINQFSMDKYGDYFRIATNGAKYGNQTATFVYVLDKDMRVVGCLLNIAPGEQLKAARFMGNTLYLVTFYQTDPLFVIDLTDPARPEIKGELKIPGFSSYLHPIGDGLVIGVGEGGTMSGTDGSAKVSLFDVSDPCYPKEIDNYTIAQGYFDTNHKAYMKVDEDTFALCLTGYNYNYNNYNETYKVVMFDLTDNGITVHGSYEGFSWESGSAYYSGALRGAFINDTVFAVNSYGIRAYSMTTNELLGEKEF